MSGSPIPHGGTSPQSWSAVMLSNGAKQGLFPILPACSLGEKELQMNDASMFAQKHRHGFLPTYLLSYLENLAAYIRQPELALLTMQEGAY